MTFSQSKNFYFFTIKEHYVSYDNWIILAWVLPNIATTYTCKANSIGMNRIGRSKLTKFLITRVLTHKSINLNILGKNLVFEWFLISFIYFFPLQFLQLTFDGTTGLLKSMKDLISNTTTQVSQSFYWYESSEGSKTSSQASGAYIFRPNKTEPTPLFDGSSVHLNLVTVGIVLFRNYWKFQIINWNSKLSASNNENPLRVMSKCIVYQTQSRGRSRSSIVGGLQRLHDMFASTTSQARSTNVKWPWIVHTYLNMGQRSVCSLSSIK